MSDSLSRTCRRGRWPPWIMAFSCFPHSSVGKESACNAGDLGSIPGSGRYPGEGNGNPLQYSRLENPMDRGVWRATAHGIARVGHDLATKPPWRFSIDYENICKTRCWIALWGSEGALHSGDENCSLKEKSESPWSVQVSTVVSPLISTILTSPSLLSGLCSPGAQTQLCNPEGLVHRHLPPDTTPSL